MTDGRDERPIVGLRTLIEGFGQARIRYEEAKLQPDPALAFHPLFEALAWAASIDERLGLPAEPHLRGLRFARHCVHHQWADALYITEGAVLPFYLPMVLFEWTWREELPPPQNRTDEPAYRDHLAGRPARFALEAVWDYLQNVEDSGHA